jgi:acyl carrier protein
MIEYIVLTPSLHRLDKDEIVQKERILIEVARYNFDLGLQLEDKVVMRDITYGDNTFSFTGVVVDVLKVIKQDKLKIHKNDNDIFRIEVTVEINDKELETIRDIIIDKFVIFEKVKVIVAKELQVDPCEVTINTDFSLDSKPYVFSYSSGGYSSGGISDGDSNALDIVMAINEEFDVEIPYSLYGGSENIRTVKQAVDYIFQNLKVVIACPNCSQKLRTPSNLGKLNLACPKCKHSWSFVPK